MQARTVEKFAVLDSVIKSLTKKKDSLAEAFRQSPGTTFTGYANNVTVTACPEQHDKVDYRSLLVAQIGLPAVLQMEADAAGRIVGSGTPRVCVRPSAEATLEDKKKALEVYEEVSKALLGAE